MKMFKCPSFNDPKLESVQTITRMPMWLMVREFHLLIFIIKLEVDFSSKDTITKLKSILS
jgi:hypothetical protein